MYDENFSKMARLISELRKEKKLTQKDLAQQLGVTDKAVSKWERALSCPDIMLIPKLAETLNVTISELLCGEKTGSSEFCLKGAEETASKNKDILSENIIYKNGRWEFSAVTAVVALISLLVMIICDLIIEKGLNPLVLPINLILIIWIAVMSAAFVTGKNRTAFLLLCLFFIFTTTFYFSALNHSAAENYIFNGFKREYIPHYTVILILFSVSCALAVISKRFQNRSASKEMLFSLTSANITVMIISALTIMSIADYTDINGLGADPKFTILSLLTQLISFFLLILSAKRFRKQKKNTPR